MVLPKKISSDEFENIEPIITNFTANEDDFLNFQIRNIQYLPDEKLFQYKKNINKIVYDEDLKEKVISTKNMMVMDGTGYEVKYKNGKIENTFNYSNPRSYLEKFPEIDELKSFVNILDFIDKRFEVNF